MTRSTKMFSIMFAVVLALTIVAFKNNTRLVRPGSSVPETVSPPLQQPPTRTAALSVGDTHAVERQLQLVKAQEGWRGSLSVRASTDGRVFVVDDGNRKRIAEYTSDGQLVDSSSDTHGVPTIQSVSDVAVTEEYLWIVDLLASSIHSQNRKTRQWTSTNHATEPYRVLPLDPSGSRLAVMRVGLDRLADLTDSAGHPIRSFDKLLVNEAAHSLVLDGFVALSADAIIFSGKYLGIMSAFSTDGRLRWLAELVGDTEKPVIVTGGKQRWVERGALLASHAVTATNDKAMVLSTRVAGLGVRSFIDIYASRDGQYQESLELPLNHQWTSIAVNSHGLYVAGDAGVLVWPAAVIEPTRSPRLLSAGRSFITTSAKEGDTL